ncbi:iron-sulfur cluster assembly accessory protein [Alicyclobacillus dauci]|uniref:Iron-sulfur cluster assembly accessory protein n=1 Tax=Alicyclobacillus dauci TaxID=1475485 RepID=A0ABY6Z8R7_9BACL|nr:iron-sulfur cluster assembly accessory protein [Alicyclobacillus dauci]WAH38646.1 iron-sulfur cluster assembly accessory protein [Alicyclobacillus dauci]
MNFKITQSASDQVKLMLAQETDKSLRLRVFVTHAHGDHAHYGFGFDQPTEGDEVVKTDTGLEVILQKNNDFLNNLELDYDLQTGDWTVSQSGHKHHH